jgi:hypothetical protein
MLRKLRQDIGELKAMVSSINSALIVREPGTALAAEAYEGLRRQVAQATAERRAHLVELVRVLEALDNGVTGESLQRLVAGWADQAGVRRWEAVEPVDYFEVIGDGEGQLEVVNAAWVVDDPPKLIKPGLARRTHHAEHVADVAQTDPVDPKPSEEQS